MSNNLKLRKISRGQRGQLFSVDFILAVAFLVIGLGAVLQTSAAIQQSSASRAQITSDLAVPLSQMIANGEPFIAPSTPYCVRWSNQTDAMDNPSCHSFSCGPSGGNIYASQRLIQCYNSTFVPPALNGTCLMTVYTCE
jgi:hypothetical protein